MSRLTNEDRIYRLCEALIDMVESFPFKDSDFVVDNLKDIMKEIENEGSNK